MKKLSIMLMAALVAMTSYAQMPVGGLTQASHAKGEAQLHAPQTLTNIQAKPAKKHAKKAPRRVLGSIDELVGDVIVTSTYYDYTEAEGFVMDSPAAGGTAAVISKVDDTTIKIAGFVYGATEDVTAKVDLAECTISIPANQKLLDSQYGTILLANAETDGDITGTIYDDGTIELNEVWFQLISDGQYAGYRLGSYNYSDIVPVNGTMSYTYQGEETTINVAIQQDEETNRVAIYNFADWETAIVAVLKADHTFVIPRQLVGATQNGDFYTYGLNDEESNVFADITGTGTETTLTFDSKFTAFAPSSSYWYGAHGPATIKLLGDMEFVYPDPVVYPDPIMLPAGITSSTYTIEADDVYWGEAEPYSADVQVAFDGDDVYIQGISTWLRSAWVKGTLADGKVTIPATYLGTMDGLGVPMYFFANPAEFDYDAAAGQLTAAEFSTYAEYDLGDGELVQEDADLFENVVITKAIELAATPATPTITLFENSDYGYHMKFEIPVEDTHGNPIFASKLSWQLVSRTNGKTEPFVFQADLYDYLSEDLATVPYNFTDYWDLDHSEAFLYGDGIENWQFVGLKTIYTAAGETHESQTCWWDIAASSLPGPLAIEEVGTTTSRGTSYDLQGRRVEGALTKGLYIRDGKKFVVK